ncbi:flocculation-associated PEP-CTERM protein PepA [Thiobacillus denitrificans]|uniref:flocculation-associated PEP-CTERM protein PepA n=1 Tax=Thiobacillus denitrificans TaxID=36861 RepID=UPI000B2237DD|nr:flocculation-associated PEP-CTERM protein PepA [Thiobacillus denitrificans]
MNLKKSLLGVSLAASLGFGAAANAAFVMEDLTIDFTSVGGPVVMGVDAIGFNDAPFRSILTDVNGNGLDAGDFYTVTGKGAAGTLLSNEDGTISPSGFGLAGGFELTFDFNLDVLVTSVVGPQINFTHMAGADALRFYLDDLDAANGDGGVKSNPGTGLGYTDGTLVLTFDVLAGEGGSVNVSTLFDGSDDATFILAAINTAGIFKDSEGKPFVIGSTLALTDSNFDLDSNNNNKLDETRGGFGCTEANQSAGFFCGVEDGTVRFAVPEPGTLAIMGLGLLGLGWSARRKASV